MLAASLVLRPSSSLVALAAGMLAFATTGCAATTRSTVHEVLPLRTLRLYESGVGYFERSGQLSLASMSLPVPAGQLDDALKSLVVIGAHGKSRVEAVEFPSSVGRAMARALAGLPRDADAPVAYRDLLGSLRGGRVTVRSRSRGELTGRVIDVVPAPEPAEPVAAASSSGAASSSTTAAASVPATPAEPGFTLLLLGDGGQLDRIHSADVETVRALDAAFASHLDAALDALAPHGSHDRALEVFAHASGPLTLGYVAETPVYRTTYRLVFADAAPGEARAGVSAGVNAAAPTSGRAVLQGWALLHNDTEETWSGVKVELANGRPDSFLVPLAAPRYDRRELVAPERSLSTVPQLLDQTPDGIWGDNVDGESIGLSGIGTGGGGSGYGSGSGHLSGSHTVSAPSVRADDDLKVGNLAQVSEAAGVEAGALFVYSLAQPLDLAARSSALVPFLERTLTVDEITWLADLDAKPRSAAHLVNDSPQTIPAGPISFFAHGGFAGEASLDRLKPGARAFIDYGDELDVIIKRETVSTHDEPQHITFAGGQLVEHFLRTTSFTFDLENRSGRTRSLFVELPIVTNAKVEGADRLEFDSKRARPVAIFSLPPTSSAKPAVRPVKLVEGLVLGATLTQLTARSLEKLAADLKGDDARAATEIWHRVQEIEQTHDKEVAAATSIATTEKDLERWRETLKAAGGDHGASAALVQRVVRLEDQLTALRKQEETLKAERQTRTNAAEAALQKLKSS